MNKTVLGSVGFAIVCVVAGFFAFSYFSLQAKQAEQAQETIVLEALQEGYVQCQIETTAAINNQFFQNGFVSLPIQGQDGNFVQVNFITEQRCVEEIQKYLEVN